MCLDGLGHVELPVKDGRRDEKALDLGVLLLLPAPMLTYCVCDEGDTLQKFFSAFPGGLAGLGLILLRIAVAVGAITFAACKLVARGDVSVAGWAAACCAILAGLAVLLGLLTPLIGAGATIAFLLKSLFGLLAADALPCGSASTSSCLAVMSISLALLGPGAFSLDARFFGRREIIIPEGRRPPR